MSRPKMTLNEIKALRIQDRWSNGVDHHADAETLGRMIGDFDFCHFSDSFGLNFGGDGDNGETLIYILDELFERGIIKLNPPFSSRATTAPKATTTVEPLE
jgi:hypothetical protein